MRRTLLFILFWGIQILTAQSIEFEPIGNYGVGNVDNFIVSPNGLYHLVTSDRTKLYSSEDGSSWQPIEIPAKVQIKDILFFNDGTRVIRSKTDDYYIENQPGEWVNIYSAGGYLRISQDVIYILEHYPTDNDSVDITIIKSVDRGQNFTTEYILKSPSYVDAFNVSDSYIYFVDYSELFVLDKNFNLITNSILEFTRGGSNWAVNLQATDEIIVTTVRSFSKGTPFTEGWDYCYYEVFSSTGTNIDLFDGPDVNCFYIGFDNLYFCDESKINILSLDNHERKEVPFPTRDNMTGHLDQLYFYDAYGVCKADINNMNCQDLILPEVDSLEISNFKVGKGGDLYVRTQGKLVKSVDRGKNWVAQEFDVNKSPRNKDYISSFTLDSEDKLIAYDGNLIHYTNPDGSLRTVDDYRKPFVGSDSLNVYRIADDFIFFTNGIDSQVVYSICCRPEFIAPNTLIAGNYHQLDSLTIINNKVLELENYSYTQWIEGVPDQLLFSSDDLIHFNLESGYGPSYVTRNKGQSIEALAPGPGGKILQGPNEVSTYVFDPSVQKIFLREDLSSVYNELSYLGLGDNKIMEMQTDGKGNIYVSALDPISNSKYFYKGSLKCNNDDFTYLLNLEYLLCSGDTMNGYSSDIIYSETYISQGGCDSIVTYNLDFNEATISYEESVLLCEGDLYEGTQYDQSTELRDTTFENGQCNINIIPIRVGKNYTDFEQTLYFCRGDTFLGSTVPFDEFISETTIFGCDSTGHTQTQYYDTEISKAEKFVEFADSLSCSENSVVVYEDVNGCEAYDIESTVVLHPKSCREEWTTEIENVEQSYNHDMDVSGHRCVIAAPDDNEKGEKAGAIYIREWDGQEWQVTKIMASDGEDFDRFGTCVAISGDRIIVGAPLENGQSVDRGAAYLYEWNGLEWTEQKFPSPFSVDGTRFGSYVDIDGDNFVVASKSSGTLDVYSKVDEQWDYQVIFSNIPLARLSNVAIHENRLVAADIFGHLHLFEKNTFSNWRFEKHLTRDLDDVAVFSAVSDLDINENYIASSFSNLYSDENTYGGGVIVYDLETLDSTILTSKDGRQGDRFGWSIAMHQNKILIGAPSDIQADSSATLKGAAYLYENLNGKWCEQKIKEEGSATSENNFGATVAINENFMAIRGHNEEDKIFFYGDNTMPQDTISKLICEGDSYLGYTTSGIYNFTSSMFDGCEKEVTLQLEVLEETDALCNTSSIAENKDISASVYPNPFKSSFEINYNYQDLEQITISNLAGQVIIKIKQPKQKEVVDMSQYKSGLYFVKFLDRGQSTVLKVIKV